MQDIQKIAKRGAAFVADRIGSIWSRSAGSLRGRFTRQQVTLILAAAAILLLAFFWMAWPNGTHPRDAKSARNRPRNSHATYAATESPIGGRGTASTRSRGREGSPGPGVRGAEGDNWWYQDSQRDAKAKTARTRPHSARNGGGDQWWYAEKKDAKPEDPGEPPVEERSQEKAAAHETPEAPRETAREGESDDWWRN